MPIILSSLPATGTILEFDPTSEDATNTSLVVVDNASYFLLAEDWPEPDIDQQTVSSVSTEGELAVSARHKNTTGAFTLRVVGSTPAALQTALNRIDKKLAKIMREGGTLKRTAATGDTYVSDILSGTQSVGFSKRFLTNNIAECVVTLARRPYWRGAPVTKSSHAETTLPVNIFTETTIKGDVPGLGDFVITEAQGVDQFWLTYGVRSRYYSSSADAALYYEAEGRTPLGGGAATAAGPTGASGGGSNTILANNLGSVYQAIMSTQASGGGNHLTHIGDYRVYARVQTPAANTGTVSIIWQWATGDFRSPTTNTATALAGIGTWQLIDMGTVSIPSTATRWEGRLLAASTHAGDDVYVDHFMLVPITEGSGIVSGQPDGSAPTTFTVRDEFDQTSGALNTKVAPTGGTWATSGVATDFQVSGSGTVTRSSSVDAGAYRWAISGASAAAAQASQVDFISNAAADSAVIARWVDSSNYLILSTAPFVTPLSGVLVQVVVAGSAVLNLSAPLRYTFTSSTTWTMRLSVDAGGRFWAWLAPRGSALGAPIIVGQHSALATGGALATGKPGFADSGTTGASTRTYDNFTAWTPTADAAVFASRQAEIRHNRVTRQDSGGTFSVTPSKFQGDYLLIPPAGVEGRTFQGFVKACRNDPATMADSAIDDITVQLTYTPRFLTLPE